MNGLYDRAGEGVTGLNSKRSNVIASSNNSLRCQQRDYVIDVQM